MHWWLLQYHTSICSTSARSSVAANVTEPKILGGNSSGAIHFVQFCILESDTATDKLLYFNIIYKDLVKYSA